MLHAKFAHIERLVKFGVKNIWLHKLRSFLTMLGIVFGVASVIAMLAIGQGASYEAREKIKELGSDNIIIRSVLPPDDATNQQVIFMNVYGLLPDDLDRIGSIPSVRQVIPVWETDDVLWRYEKNIPARLVGTVPECAPAVNMTVSEGRFLQSSDLTGMRPVAVIGAAVRDALFPGEDPLGKTVKLRGNYFTIIGVVARRGVSPVAGMEAEDPNKELYIPLPAARAIFGEYEVHKRSGGMSSWERNWVRFHRFIVRVENTEKVLATAGLIETILNEAHKKKDFEMVVPLQLLQQAEHTKRIFTIVLGSIAAISLLVGGIGIMNIMLATVNERMREIGIRRAVGAKRSDIIVQFLTEAVLLSAVGGFIGVGLGVSIPFLVTAFAGMKTIVTIWSVLLSFIISVTVGVIFGFYPARQAAFLDPIQVLRHD